MTFLALPNVTSSGDDHVQYLGLCRQMCEGLIQYLTVKLRVEEGP